VAIWRFPITSTQRAKRPAITMAARTARKAAGTDHTGRRPRIAALIRPGRAAVGAATDAATHRIYSEVRTRLLTARTQRSLRPQPKRLADAPSEHRSPHPALAWTACSLKRPHPRE